MSAPVVDVDVDVDQGAELTCAQCGQSFEHTGRGRKPKRCPDCRRSRRSPNSSSPAGAGDDEAPKRPRGVETLRNNIAQQLAMLGMALAFFDPFDAQIIVSKAKVGADALANLAATNPKIRRLLESSVEAAGWGPVLMWGAQVVLPIAAHHGLIRGVPDPAAVAAKNGAVNGTL